MVAVVCSGVVVVHWLWWRRGVGRNRKVYIHAPEPRLQTPDDGRVQNFFEESVDFPSPNS